MAVTLDDIENVHDFTVDEMSEIIIKELKESTELNRKLVFNFLMTSSANSLLMVDAIENKTIDKMGEHQRKSLIANWLMSLKLYYSIKDEIRHHVIRNKKFKQSRKTLEKFISDYDESMELQRNLLTKIAGSDIVDLFLESDMDESEMASSLGYLGG